MPELPEVETLRRDLESSVLRRRVEAVTVHDPGRVRSLVDEDFSSALTGRTLVAADRLGKYLILRLDDGRVWAVHLSLEGRLLLRPPQSPALDGSRLSVVLDDQSELLLWDAMTYASSALGTPEQVTLLYHLETFGPEPTAAAFTEPLFEALFAKRRGMLKPLLLDQHVIAGVGNIYADEALWRARLHPTRKVNTLTHEDLEALHGALVEVLREGIEHRGTTAPGGLYRDLFGRKGSHQAHLAVFRRAGKPCPRCGTAIARSVVGARSTFVCPTCQSVDDPIANIEVEPRTVVVKRERRRAA